MKTKLLFFFSLVITNVCNAQNSVNDSIAFHQSLINQSEFQIPKLRSSNTANIGSFKLGGDENTYYPVIFEDKGWDYNEATILELNRSVVHGDNQWYGSITARFRFRVSRYGNGSEFIDADVKQYNQQYMPLIAGWKDLTISSGGSSIAIWLRGNTTYTFRSNYPQTPKFTDGPIDGIPTKTSVDSYVNSNGITVPNAIWVNSGRHSYFYGGIAIGTNKPNPAYKLDVNGKIHAEEIVIDTQKWPDYVFDDNYNLPTLSEVEQHIKEHKHLPDLPSEKEVVEKGVNVVEMQAKLLQKIEELTLYVIEQNKEIKALKTDLKIEKAKNADK